MDPLGRTEKKKVSPELSKAQSQKVHLDCQYGIRAQKPIHGMVFGL